MTRKTLILNRKSPHLTEGMGMKTLSIISLYIKFLICTQQSLTSSNKPNLFTLLASYVSYFYCYYNITDTKTDNKIARQQNKVLLFFTYQCVYGSLVLPQMWSPEDTQMSREVTQIGL